MIPSLMFGLHKRAAADGQWLCTPGRRPLQSSEWKGIFPFPAPAGPPLRNGRRVSTLRSGKRIPAIPAGNRELAQRPGLTAGSAPFPCGKPPPSITPLGASSLSARRKPLHLAPLAEAPAAQSIHTRETGLFLPRGHGCHAGTSPPHRKPGPSVHVPQTPTRGGERHGCPRRPAGGPPTPAHGWKKLRFAHREAGDVANSHARMEKAPSPAKRPIARRRTSRLRGRRRKTAAGLDRGRSVP